MDLEPQMELERGKEEISYNSSDDEAIDSKSREGEGEGEKELKAIKVSPSCFPNACKCGHGKIIRDVYLQRIGERNFYLGLDISPKAKIVDVKLK